MRTDTHFKLLIYCYTAQPPMQSNSTISYLKQIVQNSNEWTFEIWFSTINGFDSASYEDNIVGGFGNWTSANTSTPDPGQCNVGSNPQYYNPTSLFVAQNGDNMLLLAKSGGGGACAVTTAGMAAGNTNMQHFVVSTNGTVLTPCLNGVCASPTSNFLNNVSIWNSAYYLMFGASVPQAGLNYDDNYMWQGYLYLAAFYSRNLSSAEVNQNYQAGVPNSQPYLLSVNNSMTCPSSALCVNVLQQISVNVNSWDRDGDYITYYIVSLPSLGNLYLYKNITIPATATVITQSQLPYLFPTAVGSYIGYQSNPYESGDPYTSFDIAAWDGQAWSVQNQTVYVNVTVVPIPVVSYYNFTYTTTVQKPILLTASSTAAITDANHAGYVLSPIVTSYPPNGKLYQYNTTTNTVGTLIPLNGAVEDSYWRFYYISNDATSMQNEMSSIFNDTFTINITDVNSGATAVQNIISVNVTTKLFAYDLLMQLNSNNSMVTLPINFTDLVSEQTFIMLETLPPYGKLYINGIFINMTTTPVPFTLGKDVLQYTSTQNMNAAALASFSTIILPDGFYYQLCDSNRFCSNSGLVTMRYDYITIVRSFGSTQIYANTNMSSFYRFDLVICDWQNMATCVGVTPQTPINASANNNYGSMYISNISIVTS